MKKIYIVLTLALATFSLLSCDPLTKVPETSMSPASFFKSESDLELWTNKFYSDLLPTPEAAAEILADDMMGSSLNALQQGTRTPSSKSWTTPKVNSSGYITENGTFTPLMNINYFLENCGNCADENIRNKYMGVAYFFRAYFYFDMVKKYGDMPFYDHVIASDANADLNKARDHRGYVMLQVLNDCDKAYELLPESWSVYRVTKDAAMALKARAALFEGTFRKYHANSGYVPSDSQQFGDVTVSSEWFLDQAAKAAEVIIGKRSLYEGNTMGISSNPIYASYREYFVLQKAEDKETILARGYNADALVRHGLQFDMKNGKRSATQRFVNHYLQLNGEPIQAREGWETMQYLQQFQSRDPRMEQTLHGPSYVGIEATEKEPLAFDRTVNGYRIIKYISSSAFENATTSTTAFPLFRYAEVLLNYAEAKAELGTLTDADVKKTIDVLRARVGMPAMSTVPTTVDPLMQSYYPNAKGNQLAAILEVRRERTIELCFEGFRQWDLLRWKEGKWIVPSTLKGFQGLYFPGLGEYDIDNDGDMDVCLYQGTAPSTTAPSTNLIEIGKGYSLSEGTKGHLTYYASETYQWDENKDYLWPIPVDQRQITGGALSQNPGYDDGFGK